MCLQLFIDHALIFASNCNLSNASVQVNESIDMMHVYDMYTTVAPFLSNMSNGSVIPSIAPSPSVSSVVTVQETTSMPNDLSNHTDSIPDSVPYINDITLYVATILPIVVLTIIWCMAALARKYCTPCKPKKRPNKKKKSCCGPKPSRPATPKVKDSSCCCKKVSVEPDTKTPEERMINRA